MWLRTEDGASLGVHKVVLAANSSFFRTLFSEHWDGDRRSAVDIAGVAHAELADLVTAVYTGRLALDGATAAPLLAAASQLDFSPIADACCEARAREYEPGSALARGC